jgi:hypothetical protein
VATDAIRVRAHQVWQHGEVMIAEDHERMLLVVPGSRVDTETALDAIARLARAVGAASGSYAVRLEVRF